jgi:hypothetical protein
LSPMTLEALMLMSLAAHHNARYQFDVAPCAGDQPSFVSHASMGHRVLAQVHIGYYEF